MSAVAALSAAGCVTTTSCRGHRRHGEPSPLVRFATDEQRLPVVQAFDAIQTPVPSERLPGTVIDFLSDIRRRDL